MDNYEIPANSHLFKNNSKLFAQVFYGREYLGSIASNWSKLLTDLRQMLGMNGKGTYGISIGFRNTENGTIEYFEAGNIFKDLSYFEKYGRRIIFVDLKSSNRCKKYRFLLFVRIYVPFLVAFKFGGKILYVDEAPTIIQEVIRGVYRFFDPQLGPAVNALARRTINVGLNGGIPVNFLDKNILASAMELSGKNFESTVFRLAVGVDSISNNSISSEFGIHLKDFQMNITDKSNEQAYRSLFWDPIITALFRDESSDPKVLLAPGWNSRTLFPSLNARFSDYAVIFKINSIFIPILLVEIGSELFDAENVHKDATKLMNTMTLSCIKLATELENSGKCSSHARVYGLWIGGSRAQMAVAHPIVTHTENGYEIHVIITFHDHWLVDVLYKAEADPTSIVCTEPCCFIETSNISGSLEYIKPPLNESSQSTAQMYSSSSAEVINVDDESESEIDMSTSSTTDQNLLTENDSNFDLTAVKKIKVFSKIIKERINFLNSERSNLSGGDPEKHFREPKHGFIDRARNSSSGNTPSPKKLKESHHPNTPRSPSLNVGQNRSRRTGSKTFKIRKYSQQEFSIYKRLALYPIYFPKLYSSKASNRGSGFKYKFEKMRPLIHPREDRLNLPTVTAHSDKFMQALTFSIHCVHGLYILHDVLKIVHADISPGNIMYSDLHKVWKINDFNRGMSVEESKRTARTSGTRGYVAPESGETKIFTELSDIYALGKILQELFYFEILQSFSWKYGDGIVSDHEKLIDKLYIETFYLFEGLVYEMTRESPEMRPASAKVILTRLFDILKRFNYNKRDAIFLSVKNIASSDETIDRSVGLESIMAESEILGNNTAHNIVQSDEKSVLSVTSLEFKENMIY